MNEEPFVLVIGPDQKMTIAKTNIAMGDLKTKLKAIFENKKNKQVYIQADRKVDYGFVAEAMAEVRAAGIFKIGLITMPKDN